MERSDKEGGNSHERGSPPQLRSPQQAGRTEEEGAQQRSEGGTLLPRAQWCEFQSSEALSIELIAPPNTQNSKELSDSESMAIDATGWSNYGVVSLSSSSVRGNEGGRNDLVSDEQNEENEDTEMNENVFHVREILADMLSGENVASASAASEKEREEREKLQLYQLRCCVLDDANLEELEKLPKRMCAYEFKPGDIAWNCRVCQVDETCVMCNDCFISSDHDDHEVFFYYTHSGGCCDCGDTEAWAPEGFCTSHKGAQDADPLRFLPHDILVNSRDCLGEVMKFVLDTIEEARFAYVIDEFGIETARQKLALAPSDARYSIVVHYSEYFSNAQEFTTALSLAHPVLPMKKLDEIVNQRQGIVRSKATREEAIELVDALYAHGVFASIVSNDYKAKLQVLTSLLHWLVSMANLSDGVCRLVCEQFTLHRYRKNSSYAVADADTSSVNYPSLRAVILADSFLPKSGSDALHSLLMALLADPSFKKSFAIAFTSSYPQLYREFVAGVGSVSSTILTFGVQFFNRASFVKLLASEYGLLEVITETVLETLRRRPKKDLMVIPFDGAWDSLACVLHPDKNTQISIWDLLALGIQRSDSATLQHVDLQALEREAHAVGLHVRKPIQLSKFLSLPSDTEIPGRCELDVNSPVFLHRRYLCGLLDLRYALQIEGVSEAFISEKNGSRYAEYLLYLSYVQGIGSEARRLGDHVETESRAWLFAVEFASTVSDVFMLIILNAFKTSEAHQAPRTAAQLQDLIAKITKPMLDAYYFWLASAGKYFPPPDYMVGDILRPDQVETSVSCHFPLHRTIAQLVRTLSNSSLGLELFYSLLQIPAERADQSVWVHNNDSAIGYWHRVHLIEPVLQAIVWDAQVHCGMWVRNGSSIISHSMNYGEPPFCTRFRDVDLLLLQFGFHLLGVDWMMRSILNRFDIEEWFEPGLSASDSSSSAELMATECLTLLCQLVSELPPKVSSEDPLRSLTPYLRREIVQRLCVGPCAHSDLSKIATEFFLAHENLFPNNFSSGLILDQILKELCVPPPSSSASAFGGGDATGGKFQYRLKPELLAEYNPTFIHLSRKQHEFAHENWFQQRLRSSKARESQQEDGSPNNTHSSWLDFPMVNTFLPCPKGFRTTRIAVLHPEARRLVYEAFWKASTDPQSSLSVLSRAVHLFTLQLYVIEEIRYVASMPVGMESDKKYLDEANGLVDSFIGWVTQASEHHDAESHPPILDLLLKLNPWSVSSGGENMVSLDGDQKHEIGRGVDWLLHRLARIDDTCRDLILKYQLTQKASKEEEDRKAKLAQRRKEAQMRAMLQMQKQQAAFAERMKAMMGDGGAGRVGGDDDDDSGVDGEVPLSTTTSSTKDQGTNADADAGDVDMGADVAARDDDEGLPECAMCHSVESEDSFMCYIGFAQCSPVLSRLNGGTQGRFLSTPIDEMHVGEDVPIHVRLCGHSVHHTCWKSYHESQFQRAITGGHHRHALNAVDVTKNEFLCPLCKSISNVLIPTTANELDSTSSAMDTTGESSLISQQAIIQWLSRNGEAKEPAEDDDMEQKADFPSSSNADAPMKWGENTTQKRWLEQGLSSLCMAIHRVACGAMQQSRPERFTASGCNALYHTLLCTFLSTQENDQIKPEQRLLQAMRFVPQMLDQLARPKPAPDTSANGLLEQIYHLLYYGGSVVLKDGTIVLENEHPSTQTQTRKQSQWGKVRCPTKPLLLNHLGSVLVRGFLLANSEADAVCICRFAVLARVVQTLVWYAITRKEEFTDNMADQLGYSETNVAFFIESFFEDDKFRDVDAAANQLVGLLRECTAACAEAFPQVLEPVEDPRRLLNIVACEVVPMVRVAAFLLQSRFPNATTASSKPSSISSADVRALGFIKMSDVAPVESGLRPIVSRWVQRFTSAYTEMNDPHAILPQWLTGANTDQAPGKRLTQSSILGRDLHTMHSTISLSASGANRTRYLRSLPRAYVKFYSELAKRKCDSCHQFPARPAVCLLCGTLLCAANTCPATKSDNGYREESNPGACTVHAKKCGRGSGMFLLVLEGAVLLVYWKLSAYVGSLYVDEYGEEFGERNRELNKGRPLYLNEERRARLLRLWLRHEIPYEVVKIQNSSERVIRNSHY
ncbi:E3 ubiquitin-protein ligase ubr2, partial [Globisporangium splendens]